MKVQSFQSNRSLISGVLLTTGTIQYHKRSKTQKAKVKESKSESGHIHPKVKVATFTKKHMKDLLLKNLTGSSSSHPPLRPLLFSSLAPSASLLRPERPPHSALLSSCCSMRARPPISSQLVNIGLYEQGSSSKMLLMATCSKKILVLGWAPPDKEDVDEQDVVDGDLLQEDLSTWLGTTCSRHRRLTIRFAHSVAPPLLVHIQLSSSSNTQVWMVCC